MQDFRINRNYAKALFILAQESDMQQRVAEDMRLVGSVCNENRILNTVMGNPTIKETKKAAIAVGLFESHVSKLSMAFLSFVVRKRRTVNLRGICEAYLDLYRQANNIVSTRLTTATPASEEVKQLASKAVAACTGRQVELHTVDNPDILGGFALEFDNNMYDARISSALSKLRMAFDDNDYESKL